MFSIVTVWGQLRASHTYVASLGLISPIEYVTSIIWILRLQLETTSLVATTRVLSR